MGNTEDLMQLSKDYSSDSTNGSNSTTGNQIPETMIENPNELRTSLRINTCSICNGKIHNSRTCPMKNKKRLLQEEKEEEKEEEDDNDSLVLPLKISTLLEYDPIPISELTEQTEVLCAIKIFVDPQTKTRPPVMLIAVIDCSGSMAMGKLSMVKQTLKNMLQYLGNEDEFCLVQFNSSSKLILKMCKMSPEGKALAKTKIDGLEGLGSTNVSAGITEALQQLKNMGEKSTIDLSKYSHGLLLLSDGIVNEGITDASQIVTLIKENLPMSIPKELIKICTFGYGMDSDESFLSTIAKGFDCPYSFVRDDEDIEKAFQVQMKNIIGTIAQNIRVRLIPIDPVTSIHEMMTIYPTEKVDTNGITVVNIKDISAGIARVILFSLKIKLNQNSLLSKKIQLFTFDISYVEIKTAKMYELAVSVVENYALGQRKEPKFINRKVDEEHNYYLASKILKQFSVASVSIAERNRALEETIKKIEASVSHASERSCKLLQLLKDCRKNDIQTISSISSGITTGLGNSLTIL